MERAKPETLVVPGALRDRESITEDIENAPEAFIGVLAGHDVGREVAGLADYDRLLAQAQGNE
jgi:NADPH-dependent curcumin reductase CurA